MALNTSFWIYVLASIGAIHVVYFTVYIIRFLTLHFKKPSHPLHSYKRVGPGPAYALITGSSAGIGLGVAHALVKEGFAVILLGHLRDELSDAKNALKKLQPGSVVQTIVLNAETASPKEIDSAVQSIAKFQVSILVNNVGGNPVKLPAFRILSSYSHEDVDAVISMNARFMARLTASMLPILSRKPTEGERSLIINLSSAAMVGVPWLVMYGATKAFNWSFSCGLARELRAQPELNHIDCLAIIPNEVRSQGNCEGVSSSEPDWEYFGQCIVNRVDAAISRGQRELKPFWLHDIQIGILNALPEGLRSSSLIEAIGRKKEAFNSAYEKSR